jgi:hypothetical protein
MGGSSGQCLANLDGDKQPHLCILARVESEGSDVAFVIAVSLLLPIAPAFGQTAAPPIAPASHRLVYLEVAPAEANRVAAALKDYRRAAMNAVGALRIDVLQQVGRSNHFAIYEPGAITRR